MSANDSKMAREARGALMGNLRRLATLRELGEVVPQSTAWPERVQLWHLVHELVAATRVYDPALDSRLKWASWYLKMCEDGTWSYAVFENEDAVLMLILEMAPVSEKDEG